MSQLTKDIEMEDWHNIEPRLNLLSDCILKLSVVWGHCLPSGFHVFYFGSLTALRERLGKASHCNWYDTLDSHQLYGDSFVALVEDVLGHPLQTLKPLHDKFRGLYGKMLGWRNSWEFCMIKPEAGSTPVRVSEEYKAARPTRDGGLGLFILHFAIYHLQDTKLACALSGLEVCNSALRQLMRFSLIQGKFQQAVKFLPELAAVCTAAANLKVSLAAAHEAYLSEVPYVDGLQGHSFIGTRQSRIETLKRWTRELVFCDTMLTPNGYQMRSVMHELPPCPETNVGVYPTKRLQGLVETRLFRIKKELPVCFPFHLWKVVCLSVMEVSVLADAMSISGHLPDSLRAKAIPHGNPCFVEPDTFVELFGSWWWIFEIFLDLFSPPSERGGVLCALDKDHKLLTFSVASLDPSTVGRVFPLPVPSIHAPHLLGPYPVRTVICNLNDLVV